MARQLAQSWCQSGPQASTRFGIPFAPRTRATRKAYSGFSARPFAEGRALQVADAYQRGTDWHARVPALA